MDQILDFFKKLFDSSDWPPRWHCGKWTEFHGWLYIISDLLIWSAYFAIPIVIIRYISRKKNIRFTKLYFLFAAFILACGATHFLDAVGFWIPVYRLSALVRFITGVVSWVTVFYLVRYLPVIFSMRSQSALEAEIAERKKSEQALKKSRKDYELLVGGVKDYAIFMLDTEGLVASWNSGAENIKGYTVAEIIGKPISIFYTPEQLQQDEPHKNLQQALLQGKFETEGWRVRKDGSLFWADVVFTALYDENNHFYGYAKVTRDITEEKKANERIRFLATIAGNIQDPIISTDNEHNITQWNKAAEKLLEWKTEEVIGRKTTEILKIFYPYESREQILQSYQEKDFWQGEIVYHSKSGKPVNVWATVSHLRDAENKVTGNLVLARDITDKKKIEDALNKLNEELEQRVKERTAEIEKNENRFRALIENNYDIISLVNDKFKVFYRSPSATRFTGWTDDEILNVDSLTNIHVDDREKAANIIKEIIANKGKPVNTLFRSLHKNGHYLWLEGTVINLLHDDDVKAIVFNFRDITERKKLEDLLQKANTLSRIGGWEVDLVKGTVYWSDITREIHETEDTYTPDLHTGINFYKEGPARDLIKQKVVEAIELGKPWDVELQITTAKNNERWVRSIGETEFADEKCVRIYGSFQDITERKMAELERGRLSERLQLATQSAQLGLWDWDIKNNELIWDEAMYRLYNISENEFSSVYEGWVSCVHADDRQRVDNDIQLVLAGKKKYDPEFRIVWKDSSIHYIKASGLIEKDSEGNLVRMTGFNWDITEQKKVEEKIRNINFELEQKVASRTEELKKTNEELEAFSYSVSHDLRAPLRGIVGFTNILEEDYSSKLDDEARRITSVIKSNTIKMGNLIDDLLSFSRLGRLPILKTLVNSNEIIKDVIAEFGQKNVPQHVNWLITDLPIVAADLNTIKQVWTNLISNAVKYSFKNQQPVIEIGSIAREYETVFFVKDNGVGFDVKYKDKLFKVFQRLHSAAEFEGTGVGLAIVEKIITKHGGKVWAEGEPGKGACFYFSLPNEATNKINNP